MTEALKAVDITFTSDGGLQGSDRDRPTFVLNPALEQVVGFSVLEASVPYTYHDIDEGNGYFHVYHLIGTTATTATLQLPTGHYTLNSLESAVDTLLTNWFSSIGSTVAVVVTSTGRRLSIALTNNNAQAITFGLGFTDPFYTQAALTTGQGFAHEALGFPAEALYTTTINAAASTTLVSPNHMVFHVDQLFLHCVDLTSASEQSIRLNNVTTTAVTSIPIVGSVAVGENHLYQNADPTTYPMENAVVALTMHWTDGKRAAYEHRQPTGTNFTSATSLKPHMAFNGARWSVKIRFYQAQHVTLNSYLPVLSKKRPRVRA